jgi:hypothetical protein
LVSEPGAKEDLRIFACEAASRTDEPLGEAVDPLLQMSEGVCNQCILPLASHAILFGFLGLPPRSLDQAGDQRLQVALRRGRSEVSECALHIDAKPESDLCRRVSR